MEDIKRFFIRYSGAMIGGAIALLFLILRLHLLVLWIAVIVFGIFIGNYVQRNRESVKDKLKYYIDKL